MASLPASNKTTFILFIICFLITLTSVASQTAFVREVTTKYYADVSLICDHPQLNISERFNDIRSLSWLFPDGSTVDSTTTLNHRMFEFDGPPAMPAYNLTLYKVTDEVFGHYTCIVVYNLPTDRISVIRWDFNVDGADFSDLIDRFEENAIIGGIAAASVLVLIGTSCIIWHFRYSNRQGDSKKNDKSDDVDNNGEAPNSTSVVYNNKSYTADDGMVEIDLGSPDSPNGNGVKM